MAQDSIGTSGGGVGGPSGASSKLSQICLGCPRSKPDFEPDLDDGRRKPVDLLAAKHRSNFGLESGAPAWFVQLFRQPGFGAEFRGQVTKSGQRAIRNRILQ